MFDRSGQLQGEYQFMGLPPGQLYRLSREILEAGEYLLEGLTSVTISNGCTNFHIWADESQLVIDEEKLEPPGE